MPTILIADDHPLFLEGVASLIRNGIANSDIRLASTLEEAEAELNQHSIDLLLLDRIMPGMFGMTRVPELKQRFPSLNIAIISASDSAQHIREALDAGAMGFIPKTTEPSDILAATEKMLSGMPYIPQQAWQDTPTTPNAHTTQLTQRQQEIIKLIAKGLSNKVIASELTLSEGTVKQHLNNIFRALNVRNRTQAIRAAQDLGLIR